MASEFVLIADVKDVIGTIVAVLVPLLWAIKQIAEATKQNKAPEAAPPAPPEQIPPQQVPREAAGQQADPLRNQVEEFLRRAGRVPPGERPRPAARDIEILVSEAPATIRPKTTDTSAMPSAKAKPQSAPRKRRSVAERATERAEARANKIAEQASQLGQRIIEEDRQFDVKLQAKFDHKLGRLTENTAYNVTESVPVDSPASQIAAMLASPDGIRQAVVINEILRRPLDRWK